MNPSTINVVFYTFSTIAQSVAGAVGLLGAIALFRGQGFSADQNARAERLALAIRVKQQGLTSRVDELFLEDRHRDLLQLGVETIGSGEEVVTRLRKCLENRDALWGRLWVAFWLTVGLIGGSVLALMCAVPISQNDVLMRGCFGIAGVGLVACVASYVAVMKRALF